MIGFVKDDGTAPSAVVRPAARTARRIPGRCQVCNEFRVTEQYWPETLPARYLDLCDECRELGDLEIARRVDPWWRRDGAVV